MATVEKQMEESDVVSLNPSECVEFVVGAYMSGIKRTPLFRGSPGVGKTTIGRDAAAALRNHFGGFHYVEINPTMPADEIGGIPELIHADNAPTTTDYALPTWFPRDPQWRGIITLDDALQGAGEMQKTLANLIQARNLRGHPLPDGAMITVTGNRLQDKAGVARTLTHFADRMCFINVECNAPQWINDFAIPNNLAQEVIGYIMLDGSKLNMFDPKMEKCPTPRTWEAVSNWLRYLQGPDAPTNDDIRNKFAQSLLTGELGQGEATRFWAFCEMFGKLPDIDKVLAQPKSHTIDYKIDLQYALCTAIAQRIDETNFDAALTYIDRIGPDLTTMAVKIAAKRNKDLTKSPAYMRWTVKNQDVIHGV